MTLPYARDYEVTAPSGEDSFHELRYPHRGVITSLTVKQVDGTKSGYEFDLYRSQQVLPEVEGSSSSAVTPAVDPALFEIVPTQTVAPAGDTIQLTNVEYPYQNADGSPSNPQRRLYVRLKPSGTGTKTFQIAITATLPY